MKLTQFKLLNEKDDSYELAHPSGKKLVVSKKGLSDKAQKVIAKLKGKDQHFDEGGQASSQDTIPEPNKKNAEEMQKGATESGWQPKQWAQNIKESIGMAKGGKVQHFDEGVVDAQNSSSLPTPDSSDSIVQDAAANPPAEAAPSSPSVSAGDESTQGDPSSAVTAPQTPQQAALQGYKEEQTALDSGATAAGKEGTAEASAIGQGLKAANAIPTGVSTQQQIADLQTKGEALKDKLDKSTIDPNRFYHSQTTGSKILSGIGLLLSGLGGGASGQASGALQMMNDAVNRDIDAQKSDQSKTMNLWKMNQEALGNATQTNLATRNQMLLGIQSQIEKAQGQFKGPIAQANADLAKAKITQEIGMNNFKISLMNGPTSDMPDPATKVPYLVPPDRQKDVFEEIQNAQNTKKLAPQIMAAAKKAASKNPIESANGKHEFEALINTTVQEKEGTARQAAFESIHNHMTPSGLLARPGENESKFRTINEYLNAKSSAPVAKGYGIDLSKYQTTSPIQAPVQTKTMGGVQYQKVPGGWQKVK